MTTTINYSKLALEAIQALSSEGFRIQGGVTAKVAYIQCDSLVYAEDIIEELCLEVSNRVDNTFDAHILYLDNHNKVVAKYNYTSGVLLLSLHRNAHAFAEYCMHVQHDGLEVFESPLTIINLLAKIQA